MVIMYLFNNPFQRIFHFPMTGFNPFIFNDGPGLSLNISLPQSGIDMTSGWDAGMTFFTFIH